MLNFYGMGAKVTAFISVVLLVIGFIKYQDFKIKNLETKNLETKKELEEANKNNKLIHEAYEKTLAIEKEIADQKLQAQEQKEVVVVKYKTLEKELEKRGEIKQDENSNFTIVSF